MEYKLSVPYCDKEEAKSKGCRWNPDLRSWILYGSHDAYMRLPESWRQCDYQIFKKSRLADTPEWMFNGKYFYRNMNPCDLWD